jgi:DNA-directed RNA polymerase subunit beta'
VVKELKTNLNDKDVADERQTLYESVKAAFGLGDSITPEGRSRRLRGALWQITGDSPKTGLFQSRVISKPVDVVGRGVVSPDPNLDMDSIGIPEDSAWTLYKDFILRKLVRQNIPAHRALEMIENRDKQAAAALYDEMQVRPVIVDRAPTWHRFNLLGFYPHIVKGNTVRVSPLITKGFTMDFDGDAVNFHVPVSEEARKQTIEKMMPSKNLFSLTDLKSVRHSPQQELALGLYLMTSPSKKPVRRFASVAAAKKAYQAGEIAANDPIELG